MSNSTPQWHNIIKDLGPSLYRYFSASFATQTAADLVQETLIRLVHKQRRGEFAAEKGSLKAYAFGIARFVRL
ncbi:MAG TPA: sigma factor, partial [Pseudobdellovibrionaceae bacterium]